MSAFTKNAVLVVSSSLSGALTGMVPTRAKFIVGVVVLSDVSIKVILTSVVDSEVISLGLESN